MHKLIVKPFAEVDAAKAAAWYNHKSEGLGDEFLLALDARSIQYKEIQTISK